MVLPNRSNISHDATSTGFAPADPSEPTPFSERLHLTNDASEGSVLHRLRGVRDILGEARRRFDSTTGPDAMRARFLEHLAHADAELLRLYRFERFGPLRKNYDDLISSETNGARRVFIDLDTNG